MLVAVDQLCSELGYPPCESARPDGRTTFAAGERNLVVGALTSEQESLVSEMRSCLARLAAAVGAGEASGEPKRAVAVALDGAELVLRGHLASGKAEHLPALIPSFVFLVTLPLVEQDEALALARRTSELVDGALGR